MESTTLEQRKQDHARMLEAARIFEARRQERRVHIAPPRPVQDQAGWPIPTLSHYLELLAFLEDSGPAPTDLEEAMDRFETLKMVRPVRPQALEASSSQGLGTLIRVWQQASMADRQAFRQWVNAQPLEDVAPLRTSAQTQRYAAEIARICGADTGPVG